MSDKNRGTPRVLLAVLVVCAGMHGRAQAARHSQDAPVATASSARSMEGLNYLGGDSTMPPFSESFIPENSRFRRALFRKGMALRTISMIRYTQNTLDSPVSPDDQVYAGQRPFESAMIQPIFSADLRQLHLRHAQFYVGGVWNWASWRPAGPKTFQLWDLYLYKAFGDKRVEVKAGYIAMDLDFVGMLVGGSTASGGQGVYAVLPYEAGMSYFPLTSPGATLRIQGPEHTYFKFAAQRSIDPKGGPTEVARNHTGLRFIPHGDKLLSINEGGYRREATSNEHEAWFRAGYMHNSTAYTNVVSGQSESGNYCGYVLMDYQLRRSNLEHPDRGLFVGGSFMTVPDTMNAYSRYFEARLYKKAPFQSRPGDLLSMVASRTDYSRHFTDKFVAEGKSVWRAGTTLTGSYTIRTSPGSYLGLGLSYWNGPAITPRVPSAFTFTANWLTFF